MEITESRSGDQIIGEGLETITNPDEFREAMRKVSEAAFKAVFQAQDEGKLQWKRAGVDSADLITEAIIKNGCGEEITVPVIFFTSIGGDGDVFSAPCVDGYLMLGSRRNAPCRNTTDPRVRRLYEQVTGKAWSSSI